MLCDNPEVWDVVRGWGEGSRGRRHEYLRLLHVTVWQKPTQHCKAIILQLKVKNKKKEKTGSVLMRWMKLEPIIQSEVSQKKNTNTVY